ncbi:flagellar biosynthetic protein FliO [Allorhizobium sp. BGMRC 0089]|uniref:flagellar biosynthetic protein FliO n=1 Tax=Allorhizobium sonneratiae TaxID=2934936 RepID=UPI002033BFFC|nr:flagellar biosynthetic protein FliO [Allorhizobium sonneratiae]MCM2293712.1 flagellar biosynthetic protein FliO [Allorhizobium sonneratiae]
MMDDILNAYGERLIIAVGGVFLALIVLVVVLWLIRHRAPSPFVRGGRNRQPRLQVLDAAAVDARRRLVLVRRDNIEHLILIGGPTDVVVESGIGEPKAWLSGELAAHPSLAAGEERQESALASRGKQASLAPATSETETPRPAAEIKTGQPARPQVRHQNPEMPTAKMRAAPATAPAEGALPLRQPQPAPRPVAEQRPTPVKSPPVTEAPVTAPKPAPTPSIDEERKPAIAAQEAALVFDAARERVLAQPPAQTETQTQPSAPGPAHMRSQPFPPERFIRRAEDPAPEIPSEPAPATNQPRSEPELDSLKSDFEKILDNEDLVKPVSRPTVAPPVARSLPPLEPAQTAARPVQVREPSVSGGGESDLQDEIARIFGDMEPPSKP